jgi:hypothetical protein
MAAQAQPLASAAAASVTLAAAVVADQPAAQAEPAAVEQVEPRLPARKDLPTEPMAQSTRAVAAVARHHALTLLAHLQAAQAAPASSSSNTTSALPQSSPSSHRRSGLHLLVR